MSFIIIIKLDNAQKISEKLLLLKIGAFNYKNNCLIGNLDDLKFQILGNQLKIEKRSENRINKKEIQVDQISTFINITEFFTSKTDIDLRKQAISYLKMGISIEQLPKSIKSINTVISNFSISTENRNRGKRLSSSNVNLSIRTTKKSKQINCSAGVFYPKKGQNRISLKVEDLNNLGTQKEIKNLFEAQFKRVESILEIQNVK